MKGKLNMKSPKPMPNSPGSCLGAASNLDSSYWLESMKSLQISRSASRVKVTMLFKWFRKIYPGESPAPLRLLILAAERMENVDWVAGAVDIVIPFESRLKQADSTIDL